MQETQERHVAAPGQEDPLEEEMVTCSSILAWRIPWTEDAGGLQHMGATARVPYMLYTPNTVPLLHLLALSPLFFLLIHVCVARLGGGQSLVFTCPVPILMAELELSLGEPHGSQN